MEIRITFSGGSWTEIKIAVIDTQLALSEAGFRLTSMAAKPRENRCAITFTREM